MKGVNVFRCLMPAALAAFLAVPVQTADARGDGHGMGGGHGMGSGHGMRTGEWDEWVARAEREVWVRMGQQVAWRRPRVPLAGTA